MRYGFFTSDTEVAEYSAEFAKISGRPVVMVELGKNSDAQALQRQFEKMAPGTIIIVKTDITLEETVVEQGRGRATTEYTDRAAGSKISECSDVVRGQQMQGYSTVILLPNNDFNIDTKELIMNVTAIRPRTV